MLVRVLAQSEPKDGKVRLYLECGHAQVHPVGPPKRVYVSVPCERCSREGRSGAVAGLRRLVQRLRGG